jgi:methionine-rich copper-binding protein CopC
MIPRVSVCPERLWRLLPLLAASFAATPAAAHSELHRSVPAANAALDCAPDRIELHFSEGVQLTALRLFRGDGTEFDLPRRSIRETRAEVIALPPLDPGDFRAEWRAISADGHPVGGAIAFNVARECRP